MLEHWTALWSWKWLFFCFWCYLWALERARSRFEFSTCWYKDRNFSERNTKKRRMWEGARSHLSFFSCCKQSVPEILHDSSTRQLFLWTMWWQRAGEEAFISSDGWGSEGSTNQTTSLLAFIFLLLMIYSRSHIQTWFGLYSYTFLWQLTVWFNLTPT